MRVGQEGNEDVLLTLLKAYVGPKYGAIDQLNSFERVKCQRFQAQWLVQYVLRLYSHYESSGHCDIDFSQKIGVIAKESFNLTSCRYVDQLVEAKNY